MTTRKRTETASRDLGGTETATTNIEGVRTMTDDELEAERLELGRILDVEDPMSEATKARVAAYGAAVAARPRTPFEQAMYEALSRIVALQDGALPPGLDIRRREDGSGLVDVLSRGRVVGAVAVASLSEREAEIAAERAAAARTN